ncbi:MAG: hypothetical protein BGO21_31550 [Dyadobacter sp. 50-39]|uniref:hypothetical protein n=1 Tax=Dyadobacter sp. 50-39 TaxID=1895756 RepID=UPI00095E2BA3|nr:hypothetical protein [Dyadobacter sp. 50-39]OJV15523.1 MAG: hypothetical protein BGO21_31550 [Dyadobacter sp. 50-39]
MPSRRGKKSKFKKVLIPVLKWTSAIVPVCAFIYVLYYYKQFDFLKPKAQVKTETKVLDQSDSTLAALGKSEALAAKIHITENEWHLVGGLAIHTMTVENTSESPVKNLEVEFKYLNDVQAVVTSKIVTIKTPLPAKKSTKVSELSVGYVNNSVVGCDVKVLRARI